MFGMRNVTNGRLGAGADLAKEKGADPDRISFFVLKNTTVR